MSETTIINDPLLRRKVVERLEQLGFYQYSLPAHVAEAKEHAIRTGKLFDSAPERVLGNPDFEELVEGGSGKFLLKVLPLLSRYGVHIRDLHEDFDPETHHYLTVNGKQYFFWDHQEHYGSDVNIFDVINDLLAEQGSNDKVSWAGTNEDQGFLVLMTSEMWYLLTGARCFLDWEINLDLP